MDKKKILFFENLSKQLSRRLGELEANTTLWFRNYCANQRIYNSGYSYEPALRLLHNSLIHQQIVLLYLFWEVNSRKGDKASLPLILDRTDDRSLTALACHIALKAGHVRGDGGYEEKLHRLRFLKSIISLSRSRFSEMIAHKQDIDSQRDKISDQESVAQGNIVLVRNAVVAHNLFPDCDCRSRADCKKTCTSIPSVDIFQLRRLSVRTIRILKLIKYLPTGPCHHISRENSHQKRSIEALFCLIEGDRQTWFR